MHRDLTNAIPGATVRPSRITLKGWLCQRSTRLARWLEVARRVPRATADFLRLPRRDRGRCPKQPCPEALALNWAIGQMMASWTQWLQRHTYRRTKGSREMRRASSRMLEPLAEAASRQRGRSDHTVRPVPVRRILAMAVAGICRSADRIRYPRTEIVLFV